MTYVVLYEKLLRILKKIEVLAQVYEDEVEPQDPVIEEIENILNDIKEVWKYRGE